jgi:hypothetical protein
MDVLHRAAAVTAGIGADVRSISLEAGGMLAFTVVTTDFAAANKLVAELDAAGLEARTESARAINAGGVESRVSVTPRGAGDAE